MTEARYRGQKVVVVSPDYAEHTKFADHWLAAEPGSDGALAMAMGHVILKEFYVERQVALLRGLRAPVHRPAAAGHIARARGRLRPRPAAAGLRSRRLRRRARERRVEAGRDRCGHRRARRAERLGRPPLRRAGAVEPAPRRPRAGAQLLDRGGERVPIDLPRFDVGDERGRHRRSAAASRRCGSAVSS